MSFLEDMFTAGVWGEKTPMSLNGISGYIGTKATIIVLNV